MNPGLFDADLKRQWAKFRLDEFTAEAAIIQQCNRPKFSSQDDVANSRYVFRFEEMHDLRAFQAALRVGDFVNNLRSALDHLAWQLALLNGPAHPKVCFPICDRNTADNRKLIKKCTTGIPRDAVKLIESFQPYHEGNDFRSTHLWRLNKLWNIDKHRHLTPHSILPEWQFKVTNVAAVESRQIDNGVEFSVPLADKDKVELNPNCAIEFTVFDRTEGIDMRASDLVGMYDYVADTVLPAFARFFP